MQSSHSAIFNRICSFTTSIPQWLSASVSIRSVRITGTYAHTYVLHLSQWVPGIWDLGSEDSVASSMTGQMPASDRRRRYPSPLQPAPNSLEHVQAADSLTAPFQPQDCHWKSLGEPPSVLQKSSRNPPVPRHLKAIYRGTICTDVPIWCRQLRVYLQRTVCVVDVRGCR